MFLCVLRFQPECTVQLVFFFFHSQDGKVCSSPYYYNSTATAGNVSGGRAVDGRDCFSELSHLDRQQLEALYVAKTRQLKEVEAEIKRVISDEERKVNIVYLKLLSYGSHFVW